MTLAGGTVAPSLPTGKVADDSWLVFGNDKDIPKERKWAASKLPAGTPVHGRAMLVDSVMQQSLDHSAGVLFVV